MKNQSNKIITELIIITILVIYTYVFIRLIGIEGVLIGFWIAILSLLFLALLSGEVKYEKQSKQ